MTSLALNNWALVAYLIVTIDCNGKSGNCPSVLSHCRYSGKSFIEMYLEEFSTLSRTLSKQLIIWFVAMATETLKVVKKYLKKKNLFRSHKDDEAETFKKSL